MRSINSRKLASKKTGSPTLLLSLGILAVLIAGGAVWWYVSSQQPATNSNLTNDTPGNNEPTKEDIKTTPSSDIPSNDIPVAKSLAVSITKLEQANGVVTIAGSVSGEGASTGTCVASFTTPEDHPVSKQIAASVKDGKVACGPITIDEIEFSFLGDWQVKLAYYTVDNKAQASSDPKTITIH